MPQTNEKSGFNYYMMNMPQWFLDLSDEEKMKVAQKFVGNSDSDEILTKEKFLEALLAETTGS